MLSLRTRIFILISVVALIILAISLLILVGSKKNKAEIPAAPAANNVAPQIPVIERGNFETGQVIGAAPNAVPSGLTIKPQTSLQVIQNGVKQLAKIFLERYGTYSTDSNFQNIKEVEDLTTPALWSKLKIKIGAKPSGGFVGVNASVVGAEVSSWQETEAQITLRIIRTEEKNGVTTSSQQSATVTLVKQGEKWLVDQFNYSF